MPPRMMFRSKQRPAGLEFPACKACNNGTSLPDLVASTLGRAGTEDWITDDDKRDIANLHASLLDNAPELVTELQGMRSEDQIEQLRALGQPDDHGIWTVDGPLVSQHMQTFAAKWGFCLHFHFFGAPVPPEGGVYPLWFSNVQALEGVIPTSLLSFLGPSSTLSQGRKNVSDQFQYAWAITVERRNGLFWASFRKAFAIAAISAFDRSTFHRIDPHFSPLVRPGDFKRTSG